MSAVTASLGTFLFVQVFVFVSADHKFITAESGQNITLPCRAPNNNIRVVKWSRADMGDEHVLFYRTDHFVPANQHPSFKNRSDLQDRQMKDGDVSLILKDVTIDDTGTYECHVFVAETDSLKIPSIIYLRVVPPDQKITPAESGQDVTLTCRAPNNKIGGVKWSRADLGEEYVLLYRDGHFDPANQHKSFKNRVDLQDRQIKDGDVSLILKDVTTDDDGKYECHVFVAETDSRKPISIIYLSVFPPGQTEEEDGSVSLIVHLSVSAVVFVVAVYGFLIYTRKPCDSKTDINQEGEPLYSLREGDLKVE